MAWNKPSTWFDKKLPEPTGTIYVTPAEAKTIPASTKATVVVAPSGTGAGSMATAVQTGGTTIRRGTGGGSSTPADASFISGGSASGQGGTITNTATNTGDMNRTSITQGATGGLPIILTQQEANQYKGRDAYWTVQSPNTSAGMGESINIESRYAGAYQPIQYKNIFGTPPGVSIINTGTKTELKNQYYQEVGVFRAERVFNMDYMKGLEEFNLNPESFAGKTGFSSVATDTGTTYSLSPEYWTTLPSYQAYQGKVQGYQTFVSTNYPLNEAGLNVISPDYQKSLISQAKTLNYFYHQKSY